QHSELLVQFQAEKVEINKLNARVKILEDNQGVIGSRSADDAPIKGRRIDEEEEEMATVLTSMDAATVLAGGIDVPTGSYSIPTAGPLLLIFTLAVMLFLLLRLQEQIDAQVARELEEQKEREDKRMTKQIARDVEVARIHAEEELQVLLVGRGRAYDTNRLGCLLKVLISAAKVFINTTSYNLVNAARRLVLPVSHIVEDFVKRLRSTLGEEGNHYMKPTEFEIQEMTIKNHFGKIVSPIGSKAYESSSNVATELIEPCTFKNQTRHDGVN
nr:hypothetical protein [Tanacetum cinerariifolium]